MRIRIPPELKESIEAEAHANSRSMNAEIVQRLTASFSGAPGNAQGPTREDLKEAIREELRREVLKDIADVVREILEDAILEASPEKE